MSFGRRGEITLDQPRLRTLSARDPSPSKQGKMAFRPATLVLYRMRASTEE